MSLCKHSVLRGENENLFGHLFAHSEPTADRTSRSSFAKKKRWPPIFSTVAGCLLIRAHTNTHVVMNKLLNHPASSIYSLKKLRAGLNVYYLVDGWIASAGWLKESEELEKALPRMENV